MIALISNIAANAVRAVIGPFASLSPRSRIFRLLGRNRTRSALARNVFGESHAIKLPGNSFDPDVPARGQKERDSAGHVRPNLILQRLQLLAEQSPHDQREND